MTKPRLGLEGCQRAAGAREHTDTGEWLDVVSGMLGGDEQAWRVVGRAPSPAAGPLAGQSVAKEPRD